MVSDSEGGKESESACNWLYNYTGSGINFTVKSCFQMFPRLYMSKFIKPRIGYCALVYLNFKYGLNL